MRLGVLLPHRAVVLQAARRLPLEVCWTVGVTDLYIRVAGDDQVAQLEQFINEVVLAWTA